MSRRIVASVIARCGSWPIAVIIACGACGPHREPIANQSSARFTGCMRATDCMAACKAHDVAACPRVVGFLVPGLGYKVTGDIVEAYAPYDRIACAAGDQRGCISA